MDNRQPLPTDSRLGPTAKAALALPVEGSKRRKVLALIAIYADAGRHDPTITELAARLHLPRVGVVSVIDLLERDGLLEVRRGAPQARSVYRVRTEGAR